VQDPAARYGEIGLGRVKLPVGFDQRSHVTAEDRLLVELPGLPDSFVHACLQVAAARLPGQAVQRSSSSPTTTTTPIR